MHQFVYGEEDTIFRFVSEKAGSCHKKPLSLEKGFFKSFAGFSIPCTSRLETPLLDLSFRLLIEAS